MDPSTPKIRAPTDGNHLTMFCLSYFPTESETILELQEIVFQSVWLRYFFRLLLLQVIIHI